MMKHSLLAFAALAALACDDPAAATLAASVLEHGAASAHIECASSFASRAVLYRATKLQDGACIASGLQSQAAGTQFSPRGELGADDCVVTLANDQVMSAAGGDWEAGAQGTLAIDLNCTGFNLEAFGVAP